MTKKAGLQNLIEPQLRQTIISEKLDALSFIVGGLSHEINNPLAIILGNIRELMHLINDGTITQDKLMQSLSQTLHASDRISAIVKSMKVIGREQNGFYQRHCTQQIVSNVLEICKERFLQYSIKVSQSGPNGLHVNCHAGQISQVILGLLSNSFDAVKTLDERWVSVSSTNEEGFIRILVTDSGSGIHSEIQDKIFDPFFSTKEVNEGTGLGLSVCHAIIKLHGGKLYLDTNSLNTRFVITLPYAAHAIKDQAA